MKDGAKEVAKKIMSDLGDRRLLDGDLDDEILAEIQDSLECLITEALTAERKACAKVAEKWGVGRRFRAGYRAADEISTSILNRLDRDEDEEEEDDEDA